MTLWNASNAQAGLPTYSIKICPASSGNPDTSNCLGTLANPAPHMLGSNTYTASGGGIDLAASTTYYVFVNPTVAGTTGQLTFSSTESDNEDLDRATGWSVANGVQLKQHTAGSVWTTFTDSLFMTVIGRPKESTAPTAQSYEISGSTLIITYDRELDTTAPAAGQYRVKVGSNSVAAATAIAISGNRVTLTAPSAAASGDAVTVRYIRPGSGNKLKDIDGNEVATQTSLQAVTNWTGDTTPALVSAVLEGDIVTLTYDRSLNEASVPTELSFRTQGSDGVWRAAITSTVLISGKQVRYQLVPGGTSNPGIPRAGRAVLARYGQPTNNKLQDAFGNNVPAFTDQTVTNNSPLVKNTGQNVDTTQASVSDRYDHDQSQHFTTGSNSGGYTLTSVEIVLDGYSGTTAPTYTVSIRETDSMGQPTTLVNNGRLTKPAALVRGLNTFTASGSGIELAAGTTYAVFVDVSAVGNSHRFYVTAEDGVDAGQASGWSIANGRYVKAFGASNWVASAASLRIKIRGTIKASADPPAAPTGLTATPAATSITLNWTDPSDTSITKYQTRQRADDAAAWSAWADVSGSGATTTTATVSSLTTRKRYTVELRAVNANGNGAAASVTSGTSAVLTNNTSQAADGARLSMISHHGAQAFTTGSHTGGYTLTSVVWAMIVGDTITLPTYNVHICNDSSSAPGATCTTLTKPSTLANGANTFTSSAGVNLDADTTYWVVFDSVSGGSGTITLSRTSSNSEDTGDGGGLSDWSIGDDGRSRSRGSTSWVTDSNPLQIAVLGYGKNGPSAPTNLQASAGNGQLSLTWTNPNNPGINKYQVRVSSDGGNTWSPDWTDIAASSHGTTSHTVTGLQNGTTYTVELRAVGDGGATPGSSARTTGTPTAADVTPPRVNSATVAANGTTLTVQLSETGLQGALGISDWSCTASGTACSISSGTLNASAGSITFTLSPAVTQGQTVRLSYSGGQGTNRIRDASDNNLAVFSNRNVINNSNQQVQQQPPPGQQQPESQGPTTPPPDPPNLARNPVAWSSAGGMQAL
ncbi:MAG: hypothetical protein F4007_02515, partial [Chloroflexi bacterium]|nr:hypothetical protein [Chloroflexota bacterium]